MNNETLVNMATTGTNGQSMVLKSLNVGLPAAVAESFLIDTVKSATTLATLTPHFATAPSGNIDLLTSNYGKIRQHQGTAQTTTQADSLSFRQIPFAAKTLFLSDFLENDKVLFQSRVKKEDVEATAISLMQGVFAADLENLAFNGDTALVADPFLGIQDGFVKQMNTTTNVTDLAGAAFSIADFGTVVETLDAKYLRLRDVVWMMSRKVYTRVLKVIQDRPTAFGDAVLEGGKLLHLYGFPVQVVDVLPDSSVYLTSATNLVPVFTYDVQYARTSEGADCLAKKSSFHMVSIVADWKVREVAGVARLRNYAI